MIRLKQVILAVSIDLVCLLCFYLFHLPHSYQNSDAVVAWCLPVALTFTFNSNPTAGHFFIEKQVLVLEDVHEILDPDMGWKFRMLLSLFLEVDLGWEAELFFPKRDWASRSVHPQEEKPCCPVHVIPGGSADCKGFRGAQGSSLCLREPRSSFCLMFPEGTEEFPFLTSLWTAVLPASCGFPSLPGTIVAWYINRLMRIKRKSSQSKGTQQCLWVKTSRKRERRSERGERMGGRERERVEGEEGKRDRERVRGEEKRGKGREEKGKEGKRNWRGREREEKIKERGEVE